MEYEVNESFHIDNDKLADWALKKIHEELEEKERLISLAEQEIEELNAKIEDINKKFDNSTGFLKSCLAEYFLKVPHKETKTQESYKLLSGSLVMKKPTMKITHDDDKLLDYLVKNKEKTYIKVKQSPDWAEFKKNLVISDGKIINGETGEVIPDDICTTEDVPASFDIKF